MPNPHTLIPLRVAGAWTGPIDKEFATLQARCALAGAVLERWRDEAGRPTYTLTRGALCLSLDSAEAVESWLATSTPEDASTWS